MNTKTNQQPTRCKPGDRARVIASIFPQNKGRIVMVIRPYFDKEVVSGSIWDSDKPSWVVASLGDGFATTGDDNKSRRPYMVVVFKDAQLQPLHDDEGGPEDAATRNIKLKRTRKAARLAVKT